MKPTNFPNVKIPSISISQANIGLLRQLLKCPLVQCCLDQACCCQKLKCKLLDGGVLLLKRKELAIIFNLFHGRRDESQKTGTGIFFRNISSAEST